MKKIPLLLLLAPTLLLADEVYLKGAGSISGRITERTATMILVDNGDGVIGVPLSRVERVVEARSPLDDYDQRAARLGPSDTDGWRKLGRWAAQAGLSTQSRKAYEKVVAIAPDDAEAREALGFVLLNGGWVTEEESYRARGFVRQDGEWMTPAEAQATQAAFAADQERREAERRAIDAEIAASEAQARADAAEKRAKEAEEKARQYSYPTYWGGWGYGVNYWPASTYTVYR